MIVPFIVSVSREVLLAVPKEQREASLALGATRWQTTYRVLLPNAARGILGSVFLALARALGETMAVTMVIGNTPRVSSSLLAPGYSIAAVIANEFTEATGDLYVSALVELGLVLFAVTFVVNGLARLLILATPGSRAVAH
jgi:phosphate transport system permease protein